MLENIAKNAGVEAVGEADKAIQTDLQQVLTFLTPVRDDINRLTASVETLVKLLGHGFQIGPK